MKSKLLFAFVLTFFHTPRAKQLKMGGGSLAGLRGVLSSPSNPPGYGTVLYVASGVASD